MTAMMKALVKRNATRGLWLEDVPEPKIGINDVLIRIDRLTTNDGSGPVEQFPAGTLITATAAGDRLTTAHSPGSPESTSCSAVVTLSEKVFMWAQSIGAPPDFSAT